MARTSPDRRVLADVVSEIVPGASVVTVRSLRGGLASLTHAVDIDADGERIRLTLRRYSHPEWGYDAAAVRREVSVLERLADAGLDVPRPVWVDADGERFGLAALLLRRLPGRPVLDPPDVSSWARGIAGALATIHAVDVGVLADVLPEETREGRHLRYLAEEAGEELAGDVVDGYAPLAALEGRIAPDESRLSHGDYHAGNVLWSRGRVSGIIDWPMARLGDRRFDVSYLRLDTALILGQDAADAVLAGYEEAIGRPLEDVPAWDLLAATTALPDPIEWLPGYVALGRTDLDEDTVRSRFRVFVDRARQEL